MERIATPALVRGKKRRTMIACIATGLFVFLLLLLGLSLLATRIAYSQSDPSAWILPASYLSSLLAALGGGFTSARLRGRQGLICGLLTGLGVLVISILGLMIFSGDTETDMLRVATSYLFAFLCATLGGLLGGTQKRRTPKRRR
ncbi:MAG: TIGR04086 family membrane protein [Clostridia bacterium]|nr:TIGR04086 family membrane protein [Clostridia bacterium]